MILLDASALLGHLLGEPRGRRVSALLANGGLGMATVNLAETIDVLCRRVDRERAHEFVAPLIDGPIAQLVALDGARAWRLGELRARHYHRTQRPVSLGDCALLACADSADSIATFDTVLIAMARDEGVAVIDL